MEYKLVERFEQLVIVMEHDGGAACSIWKEEDVSRVRSGNALRLAANGILRNKSKSG